MGLSAEERRGRLVELYKEVQACTRCPLHETRTNAVFGAGDADAGLMFVGEAPGAEEDRQGLPFVGRAGQLLEELACLVITDPSQEFGSPSGPHLFRRRGQARVPMR